MLEQPYPTEGLENVTPIARTMFLNALDEQERKGKKKYGRSLQTFNGRNPHMDALAELVDAVQYVVQAELEMRSMHTQLCAAQADIEMYRHEMLKAIDMIAIRDLRAAQDVLRAALGTSS